MARKIVDLAPIDEVQTDDLLLVIDVSDTSAGPLGTDKRATTDQVGRVVEQFAPADVRRPGAVNPKSGDENVLLNVTLEATPYGSLYGDARDYREFQVTLFADSSYADPVFELQVDSDTAVVDPVLLENTAYRWRCRDVSVAGDVSAWMADTVFTTGEIQVNAPTLDVEGEPDDVPESPELTTGAFSTSPPGEDTHFATTWRVLLAADDSLVHESAANEVDLLSYTVPADLLETDTAYKFQAQHIGAVFGASALTTETATTRANFNNFIDTPAATPAIGAAFEGGYYAGMIWNQVTQSATSTTVGTGEKVFTVTDDMAVTPLFYAGQTVEVRSRANPNNRMIGTVAGASGTTLTVTVASVTGSGTFTDWSVMSRYRVIVAPKSSGEDTGKIIKNANTSLPSASQTLSEGYASTLAMVGAGSVTIYPAAHWANDLSIGGYLDWYLPSRDELEVCFRNLKADGQANFTGEHGPTLISTGYTNLGSFGDITGDFNGINRNSAPQGAAYTEFSPGQTVASAFEVGGPESFSAPQHFSSSEQGTDRNYIIGMRQGQRSRANKTTSNLAVRAIRRSII